MQMFENMMLQRLNGNKQSLYKIEDLKVDEYRKSKEKELDKLEILEAKIIEYILESIDPSLFEYDGDETKLDIKDKEKIAKIRLRIMGEIKFFETNLATSIDEVSSNRYNYYLKGLNNHLAKLNENPMKYLIYYEAYKLDPHRVTDKYKRKMIKSLLEEYRLHIKLKENYSDRIEIMENKKNKSYKKLCK